MADSDGDATQENVALHAPGADRHADEDTATASPVALIDKLKQASSRF